MKKKNKNVSFIFLIAIIFVISFSYAELRVDSELFKKEEITSEVSLEIQNPIGKAYRNALQIYQKTKDYRKAIEILRNAKVEELIAKQPEHISLSKEQYAVILNDYGYFLYLDKQLDKALPILERVIEANPEKTVAYLNRGDIYRDKYNQTKENKYRELHVKDYRIYNEQMIKMKKSYLVPERVEKELYTLPIKRLQIEKNKRKELEERILKSAEENNTEEVVRLLKEGADANTGRYDPDKHDWYVGGEEHKVGLHYAAENNNIEMVKYLLNNGAEIVETRQGHTPLFFAAASADLEMVKYLIKKGERFDRISRPHRGFSSPIHYAARGEKSGYEVFEYLFSLYKGNYRMMTGDQAELTVEWSVMDASKLRNYEKGYRVVKTMWEMVEKIKELVKTGKDRVIDHYRIMSYEEAFKQAYINALSVNNEKLITFLSSKNIEIDKNQYIIALLQAKRFEEVKKEIESTKEIDGEVFSELGLIPIYKTDNRCAKRELKYEGNELEELLVTAMGKYDVNSIPPIKYKWEEKVDYNNYVARFINQLKAYYGRETFCLDKERVIKIIKLMLDNGLKATHFNSQFHYIISFNDVRFAKELLERGINVNKKIYFYLFANAKSMEMVRFLESEGFTLTKNEYKEIVGNYKTTPKTLLTPKDPQVIEYFESKIK